MTAAAIRCDAIKYSYRQSKDGFVVAFVIHPQEMPEALANADIGSQWQLKLVPLDSDGNAESEVMPAEHARSQHTDTPPRQATTGNPEPVGAKERRSFTSLPLPQQAALLCADPVFWAFVREKWKVVCEGEISAISAMYDRYDINTRSRLLTLTPAGEHFIRDRDQFTAWKLVAA